MTNLELLQARIDDVVESVRQNTDVEFDFETDQVTAPTITDTTSEGNVIEARMYPVADYLLWLSYAHFGRVFDLAEVQDIANNMTNRFEAGTNADG